MREIINIQIGQFGNNLGSQTLETITQEHGINADGKFEGLNDKQRQRADVYFNELPDNHYVARTIVADLEPGSVDSVRASPMAKLYNPDNFVVGLGSAGNNWAVGYYGKGAQLIDILMDKVRNQADQCGNIEGFQFMHSLSGGTGSGLGALLIEKIKEQYPDKLIQSFSLYPSKNKGDIVVDCYNATLTTHHLVENVELTHVVQNQPLVEICKKKLREEHPTYRDLNQLVSKAVSSITCGLRFPGQINSNLRKLAVSLVPFPRIHFFMNSITPVTKVDDRTRKYNITEVITDLYDPYGAFMCEADPRHGRYMTASVIVRGKNVSSWDVEMQCKNTIKKNSSYFFEWIPDNIESSLCDFPLPGEDLCGTLIGNNTSIQSVFKDIGQKMTSMFRRKAFLHWYTAEGMDEMQFTEAESNANDLVSEYQPCCVCECDQEQFDEEQQHQEGYEK